MAPFANCWTCWFHPLTRLDSRQRRAPGHFVSVRVKQDDFVGAVQLFANLGRDFRLEHPRGYQYCLGASTECGWRQDRDASHILALIVAVGIDKRADIGLTQSARFEKTRRVRADPPNDDGCSSSDQTINRSLDAGVHRSGPGSVVAQCSQSR